MKNIFSLKQFIYGMSIILLLVNAQPAFSAIEDPVVMLKNVTSKVMHELKNNRSEIRQNPDKIYTLVDHLILPHVDFVEMAKWVVGRNAWKAASTETQKKFVEEFKALVVRSYARSLLEYTDQEVEFLPMREAVGDKDRIEVASLIKEGSQSKTHMNYHLIRESDGWRVYDIIIEGVSLVQGYRAQFADDVRDGGVKQVTETMRRRNNPGKDQ